VRVIEHNPPTPVEPTDIERSVFLAGPIQGADNWQSLAINHLASSDAPHNILHILNPRRPGEMVKLSREGYIEQVGWEQSGLKLVRGKGGVILFWFEPKNPNLAYPQDREYAKTTKKELWMSLGALMLAGNTKIALGIHPSFEARDQYEDDQYFTTTIEASGIPVCRSLEDTCAQALVLA
jgi:hypothetical protein